MREILFKAKRTDNGEWVEGDLVQWISKGRCAITPQEGDQWKSPDHFEVNPDTVCQYTGVEDKKGNKIFDRDSAIDYWGRKCVVEFDDASFWLRDLENDSISPLHVNVDKETPIDCVLTGNIHDKQPGQ